MMPQTMHLLALGGALCSAASTIFIRKGLRESDPFSGFWINRVVGTISLWIAVAFTVGVGHVSVKGALFFVCAGLIGTIGGRLLRFVSIERVGASIAAALINLNPFVSSGLAILLLGEHITMPIVVGTVVIVAGTTLFSVGGQRLGVRPSQLVLPVLSATCFGVVGSWGRLAWATPPRSAAPPSTVPPRSAPSPRSLSAPGGGRSWSRAGGGSRTSW